MRWEQHANPSSHWTTALSRQWFFAAVFLLLGFHFWAASRVPLFDDELYYLAWSRDLSLSYFDHPPMVAYLIALSSRLFGETPVGVRFFGPVVSCFLVLFLGEKFRCRRLMTWLLFTPFFFWGPVLISPDVPLVLFWTLYVAWMGHTARILSSWSDDPVTRVYHQSPVPLWKWAAGGLLLGLGLLSKYTMFLAVPCSLAVLLLRYRGKAWALGYGLHLLVAFLVFLPVIVFNWQLDFAPLHFQWGHSMASQPISFSRLLSFAAGQSLLLGALPFLMLPWVVLTAADYCEEPRAGVWFSFFLLPLTFFLLRSLRLPLEANWALVAYISFWGVAQRVFDYSSFKFFGKLLVFIGFAPAWLASGAIAWHLAQPLAQIPPEKDRIAKMQTEREALGSLRTVIENQPPLPVFASTYQTVAGIRYTGIQAHQVPDHGRKSQFTLAGQEKDPCAFTEILYYGDATSLPDLLSCFPTQVLVGDFPLVVRGKVLAEASLRRLSK